MLFFLTFLGFAASRRPRVAKYVQFAHPSPRIYDNAIGCDMCQSVVQYIHKLLSDQAVESEIVKLLESFCATFPSPYDTLCKGLTEYLPTLIEWIDQGITSGEVCTKFGFCTAETKQKKVLRKFSGRIALPKDKRYVKSVGCDLFKSLVQYIEKLHEEKTAEDQIANLVEKRCKTFQSPYDSFCKTTAEQYLPLIIQWFDQGLKSSDICLTIGLCQAKLRKAQRIPTKLVLPKDYQNGIGCDMCKKVVQYIEQLLNDQKTEEEIALLVEQLCTFFPSPYDSLCDSLCEQYVPTIMQFIEKGMEAIDICSSIGLCDNKVKKVNKRRVACGKIALPSPRIYDSAIGCDMCKKVVQYIEQLLKDEKIGEEITQLVEKLCVHFPSPYDSLCKGVADLYIEQIIELIEQGMETLNICNIFGLCDNKVKKVNKKRVVYGKIALPSPRIYDNTIGCDMCKKVVQYIEQLLKDEKIEEEIVKLVDQLCVNFPSPYYSLCKGVVDLYIPQIIEYIEQGMETLNVCNTIGLCDDKVKKVNKKRVVYGKIALPSPRIYDNTIGCDMCKKVVQYIEQLLKDEKIEEEIVKLVDQLCVNFPSPYDSLCKGVVDLYVPQIIEFIEQGMETLDVCNTIGLCDDNIVQKLKSQKARIVASRKRNQHKERTYMANSEETCETCKKWVKWTTDKLTDVTIEGLWKLIHEECPKVPYLKYFCEIIDEQNIQKFVDLIVAQVPPEVACGWTHLC